jgi:hypothetical protein
LALRLTDAMLMCNTDATSALLRHGLLRSVQELTPPPPEDEESGDDAPPPPGDDEGDGAPPAAALADGQREQAHEVLPPGAEEMDSPPSPHAEGEAGWVVNCVTGDASGLVMPFRQSCIYEFEGCADGQLQRGMEVVAPHPEYGPDKLWSAEVVGACHRDVGGLSFVPRAFL